MIPNYVVIQDGVLLLWSDVGLVREMTMCQCFDGVVTNCCHKAATSS